MKKSTQKLSCISLEEKKQRLTETQRRYRERHKDRLTAKRLSKKEEVNKKRREKYNKDPEYRKKVLLLNKQGTDKNPEMQKQWNKNTYLKNKEKISRQHKEYYQANKEAAKIYAAEWYQKNKELRNKQDWERYHSDSLYKISRALRSVVRNAFKRIGKNKPANTEKLMGCSWIEAKEHFEALFVQGMCWENYGKWHIDHIRPCSSFTKEDMHLMNQISNLQPLWAEDNIKKSNKY